LQQGYYQQEEETRKKVGIDQEGKEASCIELGENEKKVLIPRIFDFTYKVT